MPSIQDLNLFFVVVIIDLVCLWRVEELICVVGARAIVVVVVYNAMLFSLRSCLL